MPVCDVCQQPLRARYGRKGQVVQPRGKPERRHQECRKDYRHAIYRLGTVAFQRKRTPKKRQGRKSWMAQDPLALFDYLPVAVRREMFLEAARGYPGMMKGGEKGGATNQGTGN